MSKFESEREEWLKDNEKLQAELQEMKLKITQEKLEISFISDIFAFNFYVSFYLN